MAMRTKRRGVAVWGVLVALALGEIAVRLVGAGLPPVSTWPTAEAEMKYHDLVVEGRDPELVIVGSSFMEAAIDPERLTSIAEGYNLAVPFTSVDTMDWWLREVVFPRTEPTTIVMGIRVWRAVEETETDLVSALTAASNGPSHSIDSWSRLWAARGALGGLDRSLARRSLTRLGLWTDFGHQIGHYERAVPVSQWEKLLPARWDATSRERWRHLLATATDQVSNVVIVIEPVADSIAPRAADVERFSRELAEIAADQDVMILQPEPEFWGDAMYADGIHFNRVGASKFTQFMDRELRAIAAGP